VRGVFEFSNQYFQNALDVGKHVVVPDPDDAVAERTKISVALSIGEIIGMLPAIDLNDQAPIAADEINE